jgi:hypothetical protein
MKVQTNITYIYDIVKGIERQQPNTPVASEKAVNQVYQIGNNRLRC